ncbi:4-hydroxy-tetrahydrodipicolinate reductase [Flavobacteriaceae bacterium MAR_2010_72]|nr:4-hydroxy-tetrahydrodipicolinate reductase [Flavobacteriaceae bacterium MAR_2010_72]TVZ58154.1 4-hydroxy-tetrahydrodipicolinate reductase [Flavobacteriaceae bacterium MAR_2010_105]
MIHIIQIGFGPLGVQTAKFIAQKLEITTVAVVDICLELKGKSMSDVSSELSDQIVIHNSVKEAIASLQVKPDIAIITTVSSLALLLPQIEEVAKFGIPIISTCEELSYPWEIQPELSLQLDTLCKKHNIACLGTGVNPGFLMDYLPAVMTSVCKTVEQISIERVQDATFRRVPFQQKIGAGIQLEAFREKVNQGTLRHVGLKESVYFLANSIGMTVNEVTEDLNPIIAKRDLITDSLNIKKGEPCGVEQIANAYEQDKLKIKMYFRAAIGEERSFDRITIKGSPSFVSEIDGGINGDIATCSIAINSIKSVLQASAGLHTMATIGVPGYIN